MIKSVIITGITGQDGSYLAQYLLKKNYKVYGLVRRTSFDPMYRLDFLNIKSNINFLYSDLSEFYNISNYIKSIKPDLFFNLGAQSFVTYSYENPMYTDQINNFAVLNILENIKLYSPKTKFYQAASSEMFGLNESKEKKFNETSHFNPISPYSIAKLSAYYYVKMYRNSYNIFASNGILFNHESPLRGDHFVTKKIIKALVKISIGKKKDSLKLGNIYSRRDWGHAQEYARAIDLIMTAESADDYVVATGKSYSVKQFADLAFSFVGLDYNKYVEIDQNLFRPNEVDELIGDPTKIRQKLGWVHQKELADLVADMMKSDLDALVK
jgi:GDPmannose 4,6-dehydratase